MPVDNPKLNALKIESALDNGLLNRIDGIEVLASINSTNTNLLQHSILPGRTRLCVAEAQQAGRGRRGNQWLSTPNRNIIMSLSWGFEQWPETITGLGLAVAMSIAKRLNKNYQIDAKIKWPNDIMVKQRKLAGILIDVAGHAGSDCHVVIGIGLNVDQQDWLQQSTAEYEWQDLRSLGVMPDRNILIAELFDDIVATLIVFDREGFVPMVSAWNQLSSYAQQRIRVIAKEGSIEGQMQGVDSSGALLIIDDAKIQHRFADSNVSVRLVA